MEPSDRPSGVRSAYEAVRAALEVVRPFAVLLKDEVYSEGRRLTSATRDVGIRSVSFQHGNLFPWHWFYMMAPDAEGLARPPLPDVFGIYGKVAGEVLTEVCGMPNNILQIVGARGFHSRHDVPLAAEIQAFVGKESPMVLIAGQMHADMPTVYDWAFAVASKDPEIRFVFKPHPRDVDNMARLRRRCEELPNALFFNGPLSEVQPSARVTVSGHSTVLLESVWLRIPAISVQIANESSQQWQSDAGILKIVRTYNEFETAIRQAASGTLFDKAEWEKADAYLEEHLGYSQCKDPEVLKSLFQSGDSQ